MFSLKMMQNFECINTSPFFRGPQKWESLFRIKFYVKAGMWEKGVLFVFNESG